MQGKPWEGLTTTHHYSTKEGTPAPSQTNEPIINQPGSFKLPFDPLVGSEQVCNRSLDGTPKFGQEAGAHPNGSPQHATLRDTFRVSKR